MSYIDLHRVIRAFEVMESTPDIVCGVFEYNDSVHKIKVRKITKGDKLYDCTLKIEITTSSGKIYIPIGYFKSYDKDRLEDSYIPSICINKHWLTWEISKGVDYKRIKVLTNHTFNISTDSIEELYGELQSNIFQYNISCSNGFDVDDLMVLDCFQFTLDEIEYIKGCDTPITSIDVRHKTVYISAGEYMLIPYNQIADALEAYNLGCLEKDK